MIRQTKRTGIRLELILVNNRKAQIVCRDEEDLLAVYEFLSVFDPAARFTPAYKRGHWDGNVHLMAADGYFPIGLFPKVYEFCTTELGCKPEVYDNRKTLEIPTEFPTKVNGKELRDYQIDTVRKCFQQECGLYSFPRGIISAATNAGKTVIGAAICKSLDVPVLFLCHKAEIFDQVYSGYSEQLDEPVGRYNTKHCDLKRVTVAMISTLYARRETDVVKSILKHFKCLIIDEVHHASSSSWSTILSASDAFFKFGLSGTAMKLTPNRNLILEGLVGPIITHISNQELVDKGVSAIPDITMIKYTPDKKPEKFLNLEKKVNALNAKLKILEQKKPRVPYGILRGIETELRELRRKLYARAYKLGISRSVNRARATGGIMFDNHLDDHVLIIVSKLRHGRFLRDYLRSRGGKPVFVSGRSSEDKRIRVKREFEQGKIKWLIATMIYKEGVDVPSIDVLVMAMGEKAHVSVLQTFGRGLRKRKGKERVPVYDFWDTFNKTLAKHSQSRLSIYREEGFNPKIYTSPV